MKYFVALIVATLVIGLGILIFQPNPPLGASMTIEEAEEAYFAQHGEYLQVLEGNKLPADKVGTVLSELGINLQGNQAVDVYENPDGTWGYVVRTVTGTTITAREHPEQGKPCRNKGCVRTYEAQIPDELKIKKPL